MYTYMVSYDLRQPGKDYALLHGHLKTYGVWARPLESLWLIRTPLAIEVIRNNIRAFIDYNDKLFVVDVTQDRAAWVNMTQEVSTWIGNSL